MNKFMKCLFYYYNYNERVEKKHDKCCNKKINTKMLFNKEQNLREDFINF